MFEQALTTIAVRITGILMLIVTAPYLSISMFFDLKNADQSFDAITYLPFTVTIFIAILLIAIPSKFSSLLFRDIQPSKQRMTLEEQNILLLASGVAGIYFLVKSITNAPSEITYYLYSMKLSHEYIISAQNAARMAETAIQFAAALWLLFGGKSIAKFILWARGAMTERKPLPGEPEE